MMKINLIIELFNYQIFTKLKKNNQSNAKVNYDKNRFDRIYWGIYVIICLFT